MALQPQGRYFSSDQLAQMREQIASEREAAAGAGARSRNNLQRALTSQELNRDRTLGEVASDTGLQLLQGTTDLGSAAYGVGNVFTGGVLERATGMSDNFAETDALLEGAKSNQLQYEKMMAGQAFENEGLVSGAAAYLSSPGLMADLLVRSAPSILPGAGFGATAARAAGGRAVERGATAAVAGTEAAKAAGRAAAGATGVQTGGQSYTDAYNQAIAEGLSEGEATLRAYQTAAIVAPATVASMVAPGLGPAAIEGQVLARMVGGDGVREGVRAGVGLTRGIVEATGKEALQETVQGTTEQAALNLASTERNLTDNLGQTAVISAIAGGSMGLGVGALRAPSSLRSELDNLRAGSAEALGDPSLGLSAIEKSDAEKQGTSLPSYLTSGLRPVQGSAGNSLAPNQDINAADTPLPQDGLPTVEGDQVQDVEGDQSIDLAGTPLPVPAMEQAGEVGSDAWQAALLPAVREIETNTDNELEEAIQITELFNPRVREALDSGAITESSIIRGVAAMRERGTVPPRSESATTQALRDAVTTPATGITEADLIPAPLESPSSKAFKAYQRRIAQRGAVNVPADQDLLGDPVQSLLPNPVEVDLDPTYDPTPQLDIENTTPNAVRSGTRESVSQIIDRALGITQRRGVRQGDLLTGEEVSATQQVDAQQAYIDSRFTDSGSVDGAGNPIYTQYDRGLQTQVQVPYQQVQTESLEFVRQRTAEPAQLWKETLSKDLSLPQNTALRGKSWNAFAEAVNESGVRPTDDTVASELVTIAERLGRQELPASKFMDRFMEKYGPGSDIAQSFNPAPEKVTKAKPNAKPSEKATGRNWKQYLAKTLGLKPTQMKGKAWDTFDALVTERGIRPGDEGTEAFLQDASAAIDAPPESAPAFAAALRTAYPVAEDIEVTVPAAQEENAPGAEQELDGVSPEVSREMRGETFDTNEEFVQYFVTTFAEAADALRAETSSDTKYKKELGKLFKKMVNEVRRPADLPALAKAMYSQLQFRGLTDRQRRDSLYKPMMAVAKRFMAEATTTEDLNAAWAPFGLEILDPTYGFRDRTESQLLEPLERELAEYKGDRIDMLLDDPANANNTSKFSRTGTGTKAEGDPLSRDKVDRAVSRANRLADPGEKQITVYDTVAEGEAALGISMPADTNGVYYNGEAAVIRENITSTEHLADTMLHERTHGGLEALLGAERLRAVNSRLWSNPALRSRIKTKMDSRESTRQDAAEEVLVDMIVGRETMSKSIFSKIRAAVNRTAEALVGQAGYTLTDADINALLQDTADYMRGGRSYREGPVGGYKDKLSELEAFIRGESYLATPKFSTAGIDLEQATRTGEVGLNAMKKASTSLADAVRSGMEDKTLKPITDLFPSATKRQPGWLMNFAPLRALANHYRGTMDATKIDGEGNETRVDTLRTHANLARGKDNDFNKTLNERREYSYRGPDGEEKMTFSNQETAEQWAAFRNSKAEAARTLDRLNNRATTYKIHPDRNWEKQSTIDYTKLPYTQAERKQQHETLRKEWEQVGEQGRKLYKQSQASYNQSWTDQFKELENTILRESGLERLKVDPDTGQTVRNKEWVAKWRSIIDTSMRKLSEGPYSPLQRHGDFFVTVRDESGGVLQFSAYDTEREAMIAKRGLDDSKTDPGIKVQFGVRKKLDRAMDGMNRKVYERLESAMEATFPTSVDGTPSASQNAAKEALKSVYLASLDDSNILKHGVKRKLTEGASLDTLRGFTSYALKSSRNLASMRYDHKIEDNLRDMENAIDPDGSPQKVIVQNDLYNAVRKQHRAAIEFERNRISEITTQIAFVTWMSSPAQMALNASQTGLVTVPRLAAKYSVNGTRKAMGKAMAKFAGTKFKGMHDPEATTLDKESPHYKVMRELFDRGVLDFTLAHDMSGLAQGDNFGTSGVARTGLRWMSFFMHKSEVMNRELATYASVELELESKPQLATDLKSDNAEVRRKALDELTDAAEEMVDTTQFDYSSPNKPANLQGPVARVVWQFQQFRINMLAMMATDIKRATQNATTPEQIAERREARRALGFMLTTQLMMTGAAGSVLAPVAYMIFDAFADDDDLLSAREQFMQTFPQLMTQGALSFGLDTARFGFDTLIPFSGASRYMPVEDRTSDQFTWLLTESLGPVVGMGQRWLDGIDSLVQGDPLKAFEAFAPDLVGDAVGGLFRLGEPTMTRDDVPYYEPSGYERLLNMTGLKSGGQAEAQHDRNAIYSGRIRARNRRAQLLRTFHLAETAEEKRDARQGFVKWNQTNPEIPIAESTIKSSATARQRKIMNAQQVGAPIGDADLSLARRLERGG